MQLRRFLSARSRAPALAMADTTVIQGPDGVPDPDEAVTPGETGGADVQSSGAKPVERADEGWGDAREFLCRLALVVLVGVYIIHYSRLSIEIHRGYGTSGFDVGLYDQGLWLLSHFKAPYITIMGRNLFGDHTSFILLFLVPLYWLHGSVETLLIAQSAAMAIGAVPVYLLARKRLGNPVFAVVLAAAFLLHPALGWDNLENFHPDAFLVPLLAFAIYFAVEWKPKAFIVFAILCLLVKEDVALVVVPLAAWVAIRRDTKLGLKVLAGSIAYALFATQVVMRSLIGVPTLNTWRIPFGGPSGLIRTTLKKPADVANYLRKEGRPFYVWQMVFPTGLVFLAAPEIALTALFVLGSNVVSTFGYQHLMRYHYSMALLPGLFMGTVYAISTLKRSQYRSIAVGIVAVCALWSAYLWAPYPFSNQPVPHWKPSFQTVKDIEEVRKSVPPDAVVSAFYSYVPHVEHRQRIYMWPTPFRAAYWNVSKQEGQRLPFADEVEYLFLPSDLADTQPVLDGIKDNFVLVKQVGQSTLYKRKNPPVPAGHTAAPARG